MNFKNWLNSNSLRIHWSSDIIEELTDVPVFYNEKRSCQKPKGLWYGCNNAWEKFLNDPYNTVSAKPAIYKYLIEIDLNTIVRIKSINDLLNFDKEYGTVNKLMEHPQGGHVPYDEKIFQRRFERLKKGEPYSWKGWWNIAEYELKKGASDEKLHSLLIREKHCMNWTKVAEKYSGIEVCPYVNDKNIPFDLSWYNNWDVASGCVWEPTKAIKNFNLLKKWTPEEDYTQ